MPFVNNVKAILNMFLPGQAGGEATRKLLYGEANPSGKLSETWVKQLKDIPYFDKYSSHYLENYKENIFVGYRYYDLRKDKVLFPFGYGLSYTDYEFTNAKIVENSITKDGITVDFDVKNIGKVDGRTTVQVYVKANRDNTPNAQLKFFEKVALAAGESKKLSVKLPLEAFGLYDEAGKMNVLAGEYTVYYSKADGEIYVNCFDPLCEHKECSASGTLISKMVYCNGRFYTINMNQIREVVSY